MKKVDKKIAGLPNDSERVAYVLQRFDKSVLLSAFLHNELDAIARTLLVQSQVYSSTTIPIEIISATANLLQTVLARVTTTNQVSERIAQWTKEKRNALLKRLGTILQHVTSS